MTSIDFHSETLDTSTDEGVLRKTPRWHIARDLTRRGKFISTNNALRESLIETLEVMADNQLMAAIRRGERALKQGKGIPWEKVKANLNL